MCNYFLRIFIAITCGFLPVSLGYAQAPAATIDGHVVPEAMPETMSETLRDPTTPLGANAAPGQVAVRSDYVLSSVLISAQRKHAVINGITLREGQVIPGSGGVMVKRISPQTVVLQHNSKTWAVRLSPSVVIRH